MSRVLILVEGSTERAIVDWVLAPALALNGMYLYPRIVGKQGHKGGNRFAEVRRELTALLRQEPKSTVTMLFDYYGLPRDWPGMETVLCKTAEEAVGIIEPAVAAAMASDIGHSFHPAQFVPYIQLHEIESLLFAGPEEMAYVFGDMALAPKLAEIVKECGGCEKIDDHPDQTPSKRIQHLFPGYKKGSAVTAHAYRIARRIGIEKMRRACPHFDLWLEKLERTI